MGSLTQSVTRAVLALSMCLSLSIGHAALAAPTFQLNVYEETASAVCTGVATCRVDFSAVTVATKITKASCNFFFTSNGYNDVFTTGIVLGNATSNKATFTPVQYLAPVSSLLITATNNQYQFLADTLHVVPAKFRPSIQVNLNKATTTNLYCSIAGSKS